MAQIYYFLGLECYWLTRSIEFPWAYGFFFDANSKIDVAEIRMGQHRLVPERRTTSASYCQLLLIKVFVKFQFLWEGLPLSLTLSTLVRWHICKFFLPSLCMTSMIIFLKTWIDTLVLDSPASVVCVNFLDWLGLTMVRFFKYSHLSAREDTWSNVFMATILYWEGNERKLSLEFPALGKRGSYRLLKSELLILGHCMWWLVHITLKAAIPSFSFLFVSESPWNITELVKLNQEG